MYDVDEWQYVKTNSTVTFYTLFEDMNVGRDFDDWFTEDEIHHLLQYIQKEYGDEIYDPSMLQEYIEHYKSLEEFNVLSPYAEYIQCKVYRNIEELARDTLVIVCTTSLLIASEPPPFDRG